MILAAHQPYFAPFPGFFRKASLSDAFLILDEVQFPRGTTWLTRNRFKSAQGTLWMTIPVRKKGLGLQAIDRVSICQEGRWRAKHLASLKSAYAHAPYFSDHLAFLEEMFSGKFERLLDLNLAAIDYLAQHLRVATRWVRLSDLGIESGGQQRLIEACRKLGASRFLIQGAARKFLDPEGFLRAGIRLECFSPPDLVYPQLWGDFLPNLSAFDLLFNCGPRARDIMSR